MAKVLVVATLAVGCGGGHDDGRGPGVNGGDGHGTCIGNGCNPTPPTPPAPPAPSGSPVLVSGGLDCTTTRSNAGRSVAAGPTGDVHVAMRCGVTADLFVASSTNGSAYAEPVSVGIRDVEEVAVAVSAAGAVFVAATVTDPLPRVRFARSLDGGQSWSAPVELGNHDGSSPLFSHEISVAVRGTDVLVQFETADEGGAAVVRIPALGAGAPLRVDLDMPSSVSELLVEPSSGRVIVASDTLGDANYYLNVSADGGQTFTLTEHPGVEPAVLGDWGAGDGRVFFAGSGFAAFGLGAGDSRTLSIYAPAAEPWHRVLVEGLPDAEYVSSFDDLFHRALAVDGVGHAYVVTRRIDGAIQLDRLVSGGTAFEPPVSLSLAGRSPAIAPLPGNDGAVVAFTTEDIGTSAVYAITHRYAPLAPCQPGGTGACLDVDECVSNNGGCSTDALCTSQLYGRTCTCRPGLVGDGVSCSPIWTEVARLTFPGLDPEGYGIRATAVGDRIYFRPETNDVAGLYFHHIDTGDASPGLSPPLALPPDGPGDFCACGYTDAFVGDETGISMLGNWGRRYDTASDTWTSVPAYEPLARGEAAGAYDDVAGVVRLVGGRGPLETSLTYDPSTGSVTEDPVALPVAVEVAVGWSPAGSGILYVAGGRDSERNLIRSTGGGAWVSLPDAPEDLSRTTGMGDFEGYVWVAVDDHLVLFDTTTLTWRTEGVDAPGDIVAAVTTTTGTYVLVEDRAELVLYRLTTID